MRLKEARRIARRNLTEGNFGLTKAEIQSSDALDVASAISDTLSHVEYLIDQSIRLKKFDDKHSAQLRSTVSTIRRVQVYIHKQIESPLYDAETDRRYGGSA